VDVLILLLGLSLLVGGGELVVDHGVRVAKYFHVSPLIIGLTIVAIGTSLPELAVGIDGVRKGAADIVLGNMAGTNVVNVLLILGLSALIRPLAVPRGVIKRDLPMMTVSSLAFLFLAWNGFMTRWEGAILLAGGLAYTLFTIITAKRGPRSKVAIDETSTDPNFAAHHKEEVAERVSKRTAIFSGIFLLIGLAAIIYGADQMLKGAVAIAHDLGVSETLIGLTVVAIGTSAPELVTTIIATIRDERSLAFGNLVGSSTLNLTIILGTSLLFAPQVSVDPKLTRFSIPFMVAVAVACIPVFITGRRISRLEGGIFVAAYLGYLAYTIMASVALSA